MKDATKEKLISALYTFGSTFILVLATSITTVGTVEWTTAFWGGVAIAALRAGIKAVIGIYVPVALGGKKR